MYKFGLIFVVFFIASCFCKINKEQQIFSPVQSGDRNAFSSKEKYTVFNIDSIDNFFLIYAEKDNWIHKIISEKIMVQNCTEIVSLKKAYEFDLENAKWIDIKNGNDSIRVYPLIASCIVYNDTTQICVEKKEGMIAALFLAKNLKGLCLR